MFFSFSFVTTAALPFLQFFHLSNIIFFSGLQGFYISRNLIRLHSVTLLCHDTVLSTSQSMHIDTLYSLRVGGYFRGCYLVIALFWHNYLAFVEHFFSVSMVVVMVYLPVWFVYCFCIFTELKYCSKTSLVSLLLLHLLLS